METNDRRVKRTREQLAKALIDLSLERGYDAVTIRDVTSRAGIGYATFFRHYADKDALLMDVLEVILAELTALLRRSDISIDPAETGRLLFEYVAAHSELCRVLLASRGSAALLRRAREAGARSTLADNTPREGSRVPAELAANHLVAATIALIQWWLEQGTPYSPARMGEIYGELIARPTRAAAFDH